MMGSLQRRKQRYVVSHFGHRYVVLITFERKMDCKRFLSSIYLPRVHIKPALSEGCSKQKKIMSPPGNQINGFPYFLFPDLQLNYSFRENDYIKVIFRSNKLRKHLRKHIFLNFQRCLYPLSFFAILCSLANHIILPQSSDKTCFFMNFQYPMGGY